MESKIIVDLLLPRRAGGVVRWGEDLAKALNGKKFLIRIFRGEKEVLNYLFFKKKGNIVHSTIPLPFWPFRVPLVLTIHGLFLKEKNIWSKFYPFTIKKADIITVPSFWLKNKLSIKNSIVIPNGIYLNQFEKRKNINLKTKKEIIFLTLTNFNFYEKCKGLLSIYKALKELKIKKKITFYILGDGEFKKEFFKKIKSFNNVKISFEGYKDPKPFFKKADIFLYFSFLDVFAISILEGMAFGLPIITNEFGAAKEIIDNRKEGIIVNNYKEMKNAILEIINKNLGEKLGENARKKIEKKFNWEILKRKWEKIYESLV